MKKDNEHSAKAPALEGGLTILDRLFDSPEGMSFSEIEKALPQSKATVVRLLKVMINYNYVIRHRRTGNYIIGPKMTRISGDSIVIREWLSFASPLIEELKNRLENTVILFYWNGFYCQSVLKKMHPNSIVMQEVGSIDTRFTDSPWGWIILAEEEDTDIVAGKKVKRMSRIDSVVKPEWILNYKNRGFAYDDTIVFPGVRRLAVPVFTSAGTFYGLLGIGGTVSNIEDNKIKSIVSTMKEYAGKLCPENS